MHSDNENQLKKFSTKALHTTLESDYISTIKDVRGEFRNLVWCSYL